jgi:hypothetical protein
MKELAGDLLIICGPAALFYWTLEDPVVSGVWVVVGVVIRWYQRRRNRPPYNGGSAGS